MADYKSEMISVRISRELRQALEERARLEQRSISYVALRAIQTGLEVWEKEGRFRKKPQTFGEEFEQAVLGVLISYGVLTAAGGTIPETVDASSKRVKMQSKRIGKKASG